MIGTIIQYNMLSTSVIDDKITESERHSLL